MSPYSLLLLVILNFFFPQNEVEIKSLRTYKTGDETSFPLIDFVNDKNPSITIEFDIQCVSSPNMSILFRFCDKDWNPYDNIFLSNPGYNTAYNLWYEILPVSVEGAKFHFNGAFPNFDVTFPFSGKWRYFITDAYDHDLIYASGKFIVVYPDVPLFVKIRKEKLQYIISTLNTLDRIYNIRVDFDLPDTLFPLNVQNVEIIDNQKTVYPIIIDKDTFNRNRFYEWNGARKFSFTANDVKPGNEYRTVDIRDQNRFSPPTVNAQYDGIETSRSYLLGGPDLNGGSIFTNFKNEYAEYMYVVFKLRPPEDFMERIFLTGAFNNWQVLPQYEMYDENGLYKITVELKRGRYDYQYVSGEIAGNKVVDIDWEILEGNYWETGNDYHVFLYYNEPELGGYDKIIGYIKVNSGEL